MKPQEKAFETWKRASPFVPHEWEPHQQTFNAGFEAGVRYAFDTMASTALARPTEGKVVNDG